MCECILMIFLPKIVVINNAGMNEHRMQSMAFTYLHISRTEIVQYKKINNKLLQNLKNKKNCRHINLQKDIAMLNGECSCKMSFGLLSLSIHHSITNTGTEVVGAKPLLPTNN